MTLEEWAGGCGELVPKGFLSFKKQAPPPSWPWPFTSIDLWVSPCGLGQAVSTRELGRNSNSPTIPSQKTLGGRIQQSVVVVVLKTLLKCNSHTMKFICFKHTVQCLFSKFIELGNNHPNPVIEHFHNPNKIPSVCGQLIPSPPQP